jgi:hypothetical protein
MFWIVRRPDVAKSDTRESLAGRFARLRMAGASESEALSILFDMVSTNGPVPEIDSDGHR